MFYCLSHQTVSRSYIVCVGPFGLLPSPCLVIPALLPLSHDHNHHNSCLWSSRGLRDSNRTRIHISNSVIRKRKLQGEKRKTHFNRYPFLTPLNFALCEWSPYVWAENFLCFRARVRLPVLLAEDSRISVYRPKARNKLLLKFGHIK